MKQHPSTIQNFFKNSKKSAEIMKEDLKKQKKDFEEKGYHKDVPDWENFKKEKTNNPKKDNSKKDNYINEEKNTNNKEKKFKKKENNVILKYFLDKEINFKNNFNNSDKEYIKKRILNRLTTFIEKYDKNNMIVSKKEASSFFERSVEKLDMPIKTKRKKGEGIFKTTWGEDIYRKYGFLGAELNKDKTFSAINKKIISYIKNNEKINKKPNDNQINKYISKLINQTDKQGMNEYQKIYRKSLIHILKAVSLYSQFIYIPYTNDEEKEGLTIGETLNALTLQVDAKTLSEQEIELIKQNLPISNHENNTLFIEIGSIREKEGSLHAEMAELLGMKESIETLFQKNIDITSDKEKEINNYIKELNKILEERKNKISTNFNENKKQFKEKELEINKKKKRYNIGIIMVILISIGIIIKKLIA